MSCILTKETNFSKNGKFYDLEKPSMEKIPWDFLEIIGNDIKTL